MTRNQIYYQQNVESAKHNREVERQGRDTIDETKRSNLVNEGIKRDTLSETIRANKASEVIRYGQLAETERSNKANETLKGQEVSINQQKADEQARANRANEYLSKYSSDLGLNAAQISAQAGYEGRKYAADVSAGNVQAQIASNEKINSDKIAAQKVVEDNRNFFNQMMNALDNETRVKIANANNQNTAMIAELDRLSREDIAKKDRIARTMNVTVQEFSRLSNTILKEYLGAGGAFG